MDISGGIGELSFTMTITRAETGKEEVFEMIGTPIVPPQTEEGEQDGFNAQHSC